ncbi:MAG: crossover junction endodeoxyribonuclease RuvC [Bacteroidia bacterium]|nr:crossover junction endodeoxyribonuclease RuvC [Bacteroidia bacterium]
MAIERIILGIDPGTIVMGYGIIHCEGNTAKLIASGVVKLDKLETQADKMKQIFSRISSIIKQYSPDEMAIEAPFYGKNAQSMLKLGRAQGVAYAAALDKNIPVFEYSPKKIKVAITGNGNASKEQVALMLQQQFKFAEMPKYLDATDGLAVAVCHSAQMVLGDGGGKKFSSWKAYALFNRKVRKA